MYEIVTGAAPIVSAVLLIVLVGRSIVSAARPRKQALEVERFREIIREMQDQTQALRTDVEEQRVQLWPKHLSAWTSPSGCWRGSARAVPSNHRPIHRPVWRIT